MSLTDIRLQNFRSYNDNAFELAPGVNIIVGPNASGKSNLLEAILVIASGKSYRAKESEMIMFGKPWARLDANTNDAGARTVKLFTDPADRQLNFKYEISGRKFKRINNNHRLPVVLFEPNHLIMLQGEPKFRRGYLDEILEYTAVDYPALSRNYARTLAQRNALLKYAKESGPFAARQDQIFAWNVRLSELGGKIAARRLQLTNRINQRLPSLYRKLSKTKNPASAEYVSVCSPENYAASMLNKLQSDLTTDFMRGFTTVGPHRDDLKLSIADNDIEHAASRGEVRTLLLALKAVEMDLVEEFSQKKPILLMDDVFSELDGARRKALTSFMKDYQTFITTTDADIVVKHFISQSNIIPTTS